MKKLESFDEYRNLVKEFKQVCKKPFSNMYYMSNDIKRYIELNRAGYEKSESGIVFFFDEENYYRACLYVNERDKFAIFPQKKKILVKNAFERERKDERLQCVESRLAELGFERVGISVGMQGEVQTILQKCERVKKYVSALEKKGYQCIMADFSLFKEIESIVLDSGIIKDYHLDYRTEEEKRKQKNGSYLCIINDKNEICAVSICEVEGGIAKGVALAVKEEYKMLGLAPVITYYRMKWLYDNGIKFSQGWALTSNEPSLQYHKRLGYTFQNKCIDEWILNVP